MVFMVNLTIIVGNYTYVLDRERITLDKYEYKVRADEIKELIARGEYPQAAEIADTIDWRRVKSVMMLCTISDLYKINFWHMREDRAERLSVIPSASYVLKPKSLSRQSTITRNLCRWLPRTRDATFFSTNFMKRRM